MKDTICNVTTQYYENYGDNKNPRWKPKDSLIFTMMVDADDFMYGENQCIEAIKECLKDQSNSRLSSAKFEYISHELVFHKPIELVGFEEKLEEIYDKFSKTIIKK